MGDTPKSLLAGFEYSNNQKQIQLMASPEFEKKDKSYISDETTFSNRFSVVITDEITEKHQIVKMIVNIFKDLMADLTKGSQHRIMNYKAELLEEFSLRVKKLAETDDFNFPECLPKNEQQEQALFDDLNASCRDFIHYHPMTTSVMNLIAQYKLKKKQPKHSYYRDSFVKKAAEESPKPSQCLESSNKNKRARMSEKTVPLNMLSETTSLLSYPPEDLSPDLKGTPGFQSLCRRFEAITKKKKLSMTDLENIHNEKTPNRIVPLNGQSENDIDSSSLTNVETTVVVRVDDEFNDLKKSVSSIFPIGNSPAPPRSRYLMNLIESFEKNIANTPLPREVAPLSSNFPYNCSGRKQDFTMSSRRRQNSSRRQWQTPSKQLLFKACHEKTPGLRHENKSNQNTNELKQTREHSLSQNHSTKINHPSSKLIIEHASINNAAVTPVPMKRVSSEMFSNYDPTSIYANKTIKKQSSSPNLLTSQNNHGPSFSQKSATEYEFNIFSTTTKLNHSVIDSHEPSKSVSNQTIKSVINSIGQTEQNSSCKFSSQDDKNDQNFSDATDDTILNKNETSINDTSSQVFLKLNQHRSSFDPMMRASARREEFGLPKLNRIQESELAIGQWPVTRLSKITWDKGQLIPIKFRGDDDVVVTANSKTRNSSLETSEATQAETSPVLEKSQCLSENQTIITSQKQDQTSPAFNKQAKETENASSNLTQSEDKENITTNNEIASTSTPRYSNGNVVTTDSSNPPSSDLIVSSTAHFSDKVLGASFTPKSELYENRCHRVLKQIGPKDYEDQATLSDEEAYPKNVKPFPPKKYATWAKDSGVWHEMVRRQLSIDPLSIFGCGVRPIMFEDIFQTPDFQRAAIDAAQYNTQGGRLLELLSKESRFLKARKWYQDQQITGFREHERMTCKKVSRFRQQIGRSRDVSASVWDTSWVSCDQTCEHDSSLRQPWFHKTVTTNEATPSYSIKKFKPDSQHMFSHRFLSPLDSMKNLPEVEELNEKEENNNEDDLNLTKRTNNMFAYPKTPLSSISRIKPAFTPRRINNSNSQTPISKNFTSAAGLRHNATAKQPQSSNAPSSALRAASSSQQLNNKLTSYISSKIFRPLPNKAHINEQYSLKPTNASISLFTSKLKGK